MFCPNCGNAVDCSMNYCPLCGHRIPAFVHTNQDPIQYYHTILNFTYEKYELCFQDNHFLGIRVWREGKVGFLRKQGNPLGLMFIHCDYDYLVPVSGKSDYPGGTAIHPIVFEVKQNRKWGVCFTHIHDRIVGYYAGIHCKYDRIHVIRKFPSVAIAENGKKSCFVRVIDSREYPDSFEEIFEVYDSTQNKTGGLYYACVRSWTSIYPGSLSKVGNAVIFDIVTNSIVDYDTMGDTFSLYSRVEDRKNGMRWKKVSKW